MNYIDKDKLTSELNKISLSNEDITRYGDGFEKAIELVYGVINTLPMHIVSNNEVAVDCGNCHNVKEKYNSCKNCHNKDRHSSTDC